MHTTKLSREDILKLGLDPRRVWTALWDLVPARMVDDAHGTHIRSHVIGAWFGEELLSDFQITTERFTPLEVWEDCPSQHKLRGEE